MARMQGPDTRGICSLSLPMLFSCEHVSRTPSQTKLSNPIDRRTLRGAEQIVFRQILRALYGLR